MSDVLVSGVSNLDISSTLPDPQSDYEYAPLPSERSIRIIEVLQETPTGLPQCKLTTINLDEKTPFIALSYTWGKPFDWQTDEETGPASRGRQISCDGHLLEVTQNLYDFLKRAAPGRPERWLTRKDRIWVDAICINQSDLKERSAQVRLMSELYQVAQAVFVWLGDGERQELQNAAHLMERISGTSNDEWNLLKRVRIQDPRMKEILGECGGSLDHWRALKNLCSRTWFTRVWIIQEVAFAQTVRGFCGGHSFSWDECLNACQFLDYSVAVNMQMWDQGYYPGINAGVLRSFSEPNAMDIREVLSLTRSFESSDPRDKIFAILGLACVGPNRLPATETIHVDYELEPSAVFLDTIWAIINHAKDLNFLALVEDKYWRKTSNMPSWVPDFSGTASPHIYQQGQRYNAGGDLSYLPCSTANSHLLKIRAYRTGEIVDTSSLRRDEEFLENCSKVLDLISGLPLTYKSGEDRLDVLWRTLIQNGFNWESPAPADTAQSFHNWLLYNIAKVSAYDDNNHSTEELIECVIQKCDAYSKSDLTNLMPSRRDIEIATREVQDLLYGSEDTILIENLESASKYRHEFKYYQQMYVFRTNNGLLGLGQWSLEPGDSLWVVPGVWLPMVFRSTDIEDHFEVIGAAYVHGIMYGEALDWGLECQTITLQ